MKIRRPTATEQVSAPEPFAFHIEGSPEDLDLIYEALDSHANMEEASVADGEMEVLEGWVSPARQQYNDLTPFVKAVRDRAIQQA